MAVAGYKLRINGGAFTNEIIDVGNVLTVNLKDELGALDDGTNYTVEVAAYDDSANQSAWSSAEFATTDVAASYLLDGATSTLYGAYGLKRLLTSYSGALIRVKDNLDVEEDIGFDGSGDLDISSLSGDTPYRIITIYDQSGNGNHKSASSGLEPTLDTSDLSMRFDNDEIAFGDLSSLTEGEMFVKWKYDADPPSTDEDIPYLFGTGGASRIPYSVDGKVYDCFGSTVRKDAIEKSFNMTTYHVYSVYSATSDWANYQADGTMPLFQTATNTVGFSSSAAFGRLSTSGRLKGNVKGIILFSEKVTGGERENIHDNL